MKTFLISLASTLLVVSVLANTEEKTILLRNENKVSIEKIKYLEHKLFRTPFEDYWHEITLPLKNNHTSFWQRVFPEERYVSYDLAQPASPFVILVVPSRILNLKQQQTTINKSK